MIDETVDKCIQKLAESDRNPVYQILLSTEEQQQHYSQLAKIGNLKTQLLDGNEAIKSFLKGAEPGENDDHFYIIKSEDSEETPRLIGSLQYWARRYTLLTPTKGILMFKKEHYRRGTASVCENLRDKLLDLTERISTYRKSEIFGS